MHPRSIFSQVLGSQADIKSADQAVKDLAKWATRTYCADIGYVLPESAVDELSPRGQEICAEAVKGMFQQCLPIIIMYTWGRRDQSSTLSLPSLE